MNNTDNKTFQYDCTNPNDEKELAYIIDNMQHIKHQTFKEHINEQSYNDIITQLGYSKKFPITKDWHVRYGKCMLPKKQKTAYILIHSCIEYIFY